MNIVTNIINNFKTIKKNTLYVHYGLQTLRYSPKAFLLNNFNFNLSKPLLLLIF